MSDSYYGILPTLSVIRAEPNTPEWYAIRNTGIGGSDAAAALGLSKWKTPYQLWLEKRGETITTEQTPAMLWGHLLEPVIRQQYAERTGRTVRALGGVVRDEKYPFMLGNFDGITDCKRLFEAKTARVANEWGESGTDEVPHNYLIQVQHYLAITKMDVADIAVLIGGSDFRIYEVPADKELQQMIIEAEAEFWRMVQEGICPELTSASDIKRRYFTSHEGKVEADNFIMQEVKCLKNIKEQMKLLEVDEGIFVAAIQAHMGGNDTLTYQGNVVATWKTGKPSKRFDVETFKLNYPDLYGRFVEIGEPIRRFTLKDRNKSHE